MKKVRPHRFHNFRFPSNNARFRQTERGQAIIEFAMVMPILILLLFGVVFFAMAFNLQMVLNAAAREGARAWASNRTDASPCSAACTECDPDCPNSGFYKNIRPLVYKYIQDNGYDAQNTLVFAEVVSTLDKDIPADEWSQIKTCAEDMTKVKLVLRYEFYLPTPNLEIKLTTLHAEATFKRGS